MRFRNRSAHPILLSLLISLFLSPHARSQEGSWQKENSEWRTQHTADLLKPDGWLSLVGLEWLELGDNSVGAAGNNKIHLTSGPAHLADRKSTRLNSSHVE